MGEYPALRDPMFTLFSQIVSVVLIAATFLADSAEVDAAIIVTQDATLFSDGIIDWAQLPSDFSSSAFQVNVAGAGGPAANVVSVPFPHQLLRTTQSAGWAGNFAPGEELLYSVNGSRRFQIRFENPVMGLGTQFQSSIYGVFTASLTPLDAAGQALTSAFTVNGNSTSAADDSAIFAGMLSSEQNIYGVELGVRVDQTFQPFTISALLTAGVPAAVPEPATFSLLLSALVPIVLVPIVVRRTRRQALKDL